MSTQPDVSGQYPELVETLLAGQAICRHSRPGLHRLLAQGDRVDRVDETSEQEEEAIDRRSDDRVAAEALLQSLGRRLAETDGVFYAVYERLDARASDAVRARFAEYTKQAPFIAEFFDILREARRGGEALAPGDRFEFSRVNDAIMSSVELTERLIVTVSRVANFQNPNPEKVLRRAVEELLAEGYLVESSGNNQHYIVAGELALFDAFRDFVMSVEGVSLGDEAPAADGATAPGTAQASLLE